MTGDTCIGNLLQGQAYLYTIRSAAQYGIAQSERSSKVNSRIFCHNDRDTAVSPFCIQAVMVLLKGFCNYYKSRISGKGSKEAFMLTKLQAAQILLIQGCNQKRPSGMHSAA